MPKEHNDEWFSKQEARLQEPIKNTKRYYGKSAITKICTCIPPIMIWGVVQLIRVQKYLKDYVEFYNDCLTSGRAITNDGAPGAGKTFTGKEIAEILAQRQWERLQSDYFTQSTMLPEWIKNGNTDKVDAFKALEASYKFFAERIETNIPCLISSIPLREYGTGRKSFVLSPEVFKQIDRVPEYSVIFNDESGLGQGADTSKTDDKDLLAFWRFPRHFFDGFFVNTNQDGGQNAIYMRRSTDYVNHIEGQEWLLRPTRLERKIAKKIRRFYKCLRRYGADNEKTEYMGQELYYLTKYSKTIGFRRVKHRMMTSQGELVGDAGYYIFPAIGTLEYDDRTFRNLYKCKDKPITLKGWEKLVVDEEYQIAFDTETANTESGAA